MSYSPKVLLVGETLQRQKTLHTLFEMANTFSHVFHTNGTFWFELDVGNYFKIELAQLVDACLSLLGRMKGPHVDFFAVDDDKYLLHDASH